ncbi:MAG: hypothetical protein ACYDAL_14130 [Candidatus Dormibacteraceae bacterium]
MTRTKEIAQYERLAKSDDISLAQSARRMLDKLRAVPTLDALKTAAAMRRYADSADPSLRLAGLSWLAKRHLATTAPIVAAPSEKAVKTTDRLIRLADRARREGWTKSKRDAEITKVLDAEFPKPRRQQP